MDDADRRSALDDDAKRLIIDCTYSGRGHQEASATWLTVNAWLGLPIVVLSAVLASGAGLSAITGSDNRLTAGLALLAAVLTATRGFFRPDEMSDEHGLKGTRYIGLRNETRLLREIEMRGDWNFTDLALRLRELRDRYNALSETPPVRSRDGHTSERGRASRVVNRRMRTIHSGRNSARRWSGRLRPPSTSSFRARDSRQTGTRSRGAHR